MAGGNKGKSKSGDEALDVLANLIIAGKKIEKPPKQPRQSSGKPQLDKTESEMIGEQLVDMISGPLSSGAGVLSSTVNAKLNIPIGDKQAIIGVGNSELTFSLGLYDIPKFLEDPDAYIDNKFEKLEKTARALVKGMFWTNLISRSSEAGVAYVVGKKLGLESKEVVEVVGGALPPSVNGQKGNYEILREVQLLEHNKAQRKNIEDQIKTKRSTLATTPTTDPQHAVLTAEIASLTSQHDSLRSRTAYDSIKRDADIIGRAIERSIKEGSTSVTVPSTGRTVNIYDPSPYTTFHSSAMAENPDGSPQVSSKTQEMKEAEAIKIRNSIRRELDTDPIYSGLTAAQKDAKANELTTAFTTPLEYNSRRGALTGGFGDISGIPAPALASSQSNADRIRLIRRRNTASLEFDLTPAERAALSNQDAFNSVLGAYTANMDLDSYGNPTSRLNKYNYNGVTLPTIADLDAIAPLTAAEKDRLNKLSSREQNLAIKQNANSLGILSSVYSTYQGFMPDINRGVVRAGLDVDMEYLRLVASRTTGTQRDLALEKLDNVMAQIAVADTLGSSNYPARILGMMNVYKGMKSFNGADIMSGAFFKYGAKNGNPFAVVEENNILLGLNDATDQKFSQKMDDWYAMVDASGAGTAKDKLNVLNPPSGGSKIYNTTYGGIVNSIVYSDISLTGSGYGFFDRASGKYLYDMNAMIGKTYRRGMATMYYLTPSGMIDTVLNNGLGKFVGFNMIADSTQAFNMVFSKLAGANSESFAKEFFCDFIMEKSSTDPDALLKFTTLFYDEEGKFNAGLFINQISPNLAELMSQKGDAFGGFLSRVAGTVGLDSVDVDKMVKASKAMSFGRKLTTLFEIKITEGSWAHQIGARLGVLAKYTGVKSNKILFRGGLVDTYAKFVQEPIKKFFNDKVFSKVRGAVFKGYEKLASTKLFAKLLGNPAVSEAMVKWAGGKLALKAVVQQIVNAIIAAIGITTGDLGSIVAIIVRWVAEEIIIRITIKVGKFLVKIVYYIVWIIIMIVGSIYLALFSGLSAIPSIVPMAAVAPQSPEKIGGAVSGGDVYVDNIAVQEGCPFTSYNACTQGPYCTGVGWSHCSSSHTPGEFHGAIDLSAGAAVAPCDGYIKVANNDVACEWSPGLSRGGEVNVTCDNGTVMKIFHINVDKGIKAGQRVKTGDKLGVMNQGLISNGNQCWSGPHYHLEVWQGGKRINAQESIAKSCSINISCRGSTGK